MKRTKKRLQLNLDTVRTLHQPQSLDAAGLVQVVGGVKGCSGVIHCVK